MADHLADLVFFIAGFDCFLQGGGVAECERSLDLGGLVVSSESVSVFTGAGAIEGDLQVSLACGTITDTECDQLHATFGELPCVTTQPFAATLRTTDD